MLSYQFKEDNGRSTYVLKFETCKLYTAYDNINMYITNECNQPAGTVGTTFLKSLEPLRIQFSEDLKEFKIFYLVGHIHASIFSQLGDGVYPIDQYSSVYEEWLYGVVSKISGYDEDTVIDVMQSLYDEMEYLLCNGKIELFSADYTSIHSYKGNLEVMMYESQFVLSDGDGYYNLDWYKMDIGLFRRMAQGVASIYLGNLDNDTCDRMTFLFRRGIVALLPLVYFRTKPRL